MEEKPEQLELLSEQLNTIRSMDSYIPDSEYLNLDGDFLEDRLTLPGDVQSLNMINQIATDFLYSS